MLASRRRSQRERHRAAVISQPRGDRTRRGDRSRPASASRPATASPRACRQWRARRATRRGPDRRCRARRTAARSSVASGALADGADAVSVAGAAGVPQHGERRRGDVVVGGLGRARPRPSGGPCPRASASFVHLVREVAARAARCRPRGSRRPARPSTRSGGRRRRWTARRRRRCRRPAGRDVGAAPAHHLEAGVEQPADLVGVGRAALRQRPRRDAVGDGVGRSLPDRRDSSVRRNCIRHHQNHYSARRRKGVMRNGVGLRDRSRVPGASSTGPTSSSARRSSRSTCSVPGLEFTPPDDRLRKILDPLKEEVRRQRPVGHPPRPRARRRGLRPAEAVAAQRDPRPLVVGADRVRLPGARHRQRRDHRPLRHRRSRRSATSSRCSTARCFSCYSMTEPHAGADPTMFTTRAVQDGDEWVINGWKFFSSNARTASFLIVMVVTNPDVSPYQGMSMFLVPTDTPGVDIERNIGLGGEPAGRGLARPHPLRRRAACRPTRCSAARARRSPSRRPASAAGASTTPCAPSAWPRRRST